MEDLRSKTALITGASSGIGKAFAHRFAGAGANVVLVARSEESLAKIAREIRATYGVDAQVVCADLSEPDAARRVFGVTQRSNVVVDVLVNNAGLGRIGRFEDYSISQYRQLLWLNIMAVTELCHFYTGGMKARRSGGVINVASNAALIPIPFASVYAASKSYVLNFSQSLHGELKEHGITVCCLCPGKTKTNFGAAANSPLVNAEESSFETADNVAKAGLAGLAAKRSFVLLGPQKGLITALSRFLPREWVIDLSARTYRDFMAS